MRQSLIYITKFQSETIYLYVVEDQSTQRPQGKVNAQIPLRIRNQTTIISPWESKLIKGEPESQNRLVLLIDLTLDSVRWLALK